MRYGARSEQPRPIDQLSKIPHSHRPSPYEFLAQSYWRLPINTRVAQLHSTAEQRVRPERANSLHCPLHLVELSLLS